MGGYLRPALGTSDAVLLRVIHPGDLQPGAKENGRRQSRRAWPTARSRRPSPLRPVVACAGSGRTLVGRFMRPARSARVNVCLSLTVLVV